MVRRGGGAALAMCRTCIAQETLDRGSDATVLAFDELSGSASAVAKYCDILAALATIALLGTSVGSGTTGLSVDQQLATARDGLRPTQSLCKRFPSSMSRVGVVVNQYSSAPLRTVGKRLHSRPRSRESHLPRHESDTSAIAGPAGHKPFLCPATMAMDLWASGSGSLPTLDRVVTSEVS
ncbi:hypothetical protein LWC35_14815 [Pseudonocardia kujensis]|uniref:hypothetical protein n=1 Tax=Pseudonocardia kujensis TaxID=1128675 RepID=UPI001E28BDDE|nr:hypothetical protein [Pseudonocardia kujensis]MCE0764172.1 hypothetical protein [Pseudonocardia kujensis]